MNPALEKAFAYLALRSLEQRWSQIQHEKRERKIGSKPKLTGSDPMLLEEEKFLETVMEELRKIAPSQVP